MQRRTSRASITELNPHLICVLCGGYLIDATTIIECLHSFCRTCIIRYMESDKYCPICDVQVHKTKPLINIRPDKTLQNLVYKLVPGLFKKEMKRRQEFFAAHPQAGSSKEKSDSDDEKEEETCDAGVVCDRIIYTDDDKISLCLQLCDRLPALRNVRSKPALQDNNEPASIASQGPDRRYLLCPGGLTVAHLKKFIRIKFDLPNQYQIEVFHTDESLSDEYTLVDIAYIYAWKMDGPLKLYYVVFDKTDVKVSHHHLTEAADVECTSPKPTVTTTGKKRGRKPKQVKSPSPAKPPSTATTASDQQSNDLEHSNKVPGLPGGKLSPEEGPEEESEAMKHTEVNGNARADADEDNSTEKQSNAVQLIEPDADDVPSPLSDKSAEEYPDLVVESESPDHADVEETCDVDDEQVDKSLGISSEGSETQVSNPIEDETVQLSNRQVKETETCNEMEQQENGVSVANSDTDRERIVIENGVSASKELCDTSNDQREVQEPIQSPEQPMNHGTSCSQPNSTTPEIEINEAILIKEPQLQKCVDVSEKVPVVVQKTMAATEPAAPAPVLKPQPQPQPKKHIPPVRRTRPKRLGSAPTKLVGRSHIGPGSTGSQKPVQQHPRVLAKIASTQRIAPEMKTGPKLLRLPNPSNKSAGKATTVKMTPTPAVAQSQTSVRIPRVVQNSSGSAPRPTLQGPTIQTNGAPIKVTVPIHGGPLQAGTSVSGTLATGLNSLGIVTVKSSDNTPLTRTLESALCAAGLNVQTFTVPLTSAGQTVQLGQPVQAQPGQTSAPLVCTLTLPSASARTGSIQLLNSSITAQLKKPFISQAGTPVTVQTRVLGQIPNTVSQHPMASHTVQTQTSLPAQMEGHSGQTLSRLASPRSVSPVKTVTKATVETQTGPELLEQAKPDKTVGSKTANKGGGSSTSSVQGNGTTKTKPLKPANTRSTSKLAKALTQPAGEPSKTSKGVTLRAKRSSVRDDKPLPQTTTVSSIQTTLSVPTSGVNETVKQPRQKTQPRVVAANTDTPITSTQPPAAKQSGQKTQLPANTKQLAQNISTSALPNKEASAITAQLMQNTTPQQSAAKQSVQTIQPLGQVQHPEHNTQPSMSLRLSEQNNQRSASVGHSGQNIQPPVHMKLSKQNIQPQVNMKHSEQNTHPSANITHYEQKTQPSVSRRHSEQTTQHLVNVTHSEQSSQPPVNMKLSEQNTQLSVNMEHSKQNTQPPVNTKCSEPNTQTSTNKKLYEQKAQPSVNRRRSQQNIQHSVNMNHSEKNTQPSVNMEHSEQITHPLIVNMNVSEQNAHSPVNLKPSKPNTQPLINMKHSKQITQPQVNMRISEQNTPSPVNMKPSKPNTQPSVNMEHSEQTTQPSANMNHSEQNTQNLVNMKYFEQNTQLLVNMKHSEQNTQSLVSMNHSANDTQEHLVSADQSPQQNPTHPSLNTKHSEQFMQPSSNIQQITQSSVPTNPTNQQTQNTDIILPITLAQTIQTTHAQQQTGTGPSQTQNPVQPAMARKMFQTRNVPLKPKPLPITSTHVQHLVSAIRAPLTFQLPVTTIAQTPVPTALKAKGPNSSRGNSRSSSARQLQKQMPNKSAPASPVSQDLQAPTSATNRYASRRDSMPCNVEPHKQQPQQSPTLSTVSEAEILVYNNTETSSPSRVVPVFSAEATSCSSTASDVSSQKLLRSMSEGGCESAVSRTMPVYGQQAESQDVPGNSTLTYVRENGSPKLSRSLSVNSSEVNSCVSRNLYDLPNSMPEPVISSRLSPVKKLPRSASTNCQPPSVHSETPTSSVSCPTSRNPPATCSGNTSSGSAMAQSRKHKILSGVVGYKSTAKNNSSATKSSHLSCSGNVPGPNGQANGPFVRMFHTRQILYPQKKSHSYSQFLNNKKKQQQQQQQQAREEVTNNGEDVQAMNGQMSPTYNRQQSHPECQFSAPTVLVQGDVVRQVVTSEGQTATVTFGLPPRKQLVPSLDLPRESLTGPQHGHGTVYQQLPQQLSPPVSSQCEPVTSSPTVDTYCGHYRNSLSHYQSPNTVPNTASPTTASTQFYTNNNNNNIHGDSHMMNHSSSNNNNNNKNDDEEVNDHRMEANGYDAPLELTTKKRKVEFDRNLHMPPKKKINLASLHH